MEKNRYIIFFADPSCRKNLMAALQALAEPVENRLRRKREAAEVDARAEANAEASRPVRANSPKVFG
jgi:hypothetical protein